MAGRTAPSKFSGLTLEVQNAGSLTKTPPNEGLSYFPNLIIHPSIICNKLGQLQEVGVGAKVFYYLIGSCQVGGLACISVPLGKATSSEFHMHSTEQS